MDNDIRHDSGQNVVDSRDSSMNSFNQHAKKQPGFSIKLEGFF